jgi:glycosyltransferase involved in cell wall biosynthesis
MSKIKVAILSDYIPPEKIGGLGVLAFELARYLRRKPNDFEITIITTGKSNKGNEGIVYLSSKINGSYFVNSFKRLPGLVKQFDILHIHQSVNAPFIFLKKHPRILATFHTSKKQEFHHIVATGRPGSEISVSKNELIQKYFRMPYNIFSDKLLIKKADLVTTVSQQTKTEIMHDYFPISSKKEIEVVHNGVDTDYFNPENVKENLKKTYNIEDYKVILYAGSFKMRKRFFNLLYCFKEIIKKFPKTKLLIIGPQDNLVYRLIDDLGLKQAVIFMQGVRYADMPIMYMAADVVAVPSSYEGLPLVMLEAMSMGKPVLATPAGGTKEVIDNGKNGVLIAIDDLEALEEKMLLLLKNDDLRYELGNNARNTILNKFNLRKCAQEYANLYRSLA